MNIILLILLILIILIILNFLLIFYSGIPFTVSSFNELKGYTNLKFDQNNWNYSSGGISKIIIKTGRFKKNEMPDTIINIFKQLMNKNPEYELYYFDNDDCDQFMKDYSNDVFKCYDKLIPGAFKADLFRVTLLEKYGGCYSDLSQIILIPINDIIKNYNMVLVTDYTRPNIYNAFMCTIPNNDFFKQIINSICVNVKNNYYGNDCLAVTGPRLIGEIYFKNKNNFKNKLKIKILTHDRIYIEKILKGFNPIRDGNKIVIDTSYLNYRYMVERSIKKPNYTTLWRQRKIYK